MKSWTVRQRIVLGFSAVILIMVILSTSAFFLLSEIKSKAVVVSGDAWPGLYFSAQIEARAMDVLAAVYRSSLESDESEKRRLQGEIHSSKALLDGAMRNYEQTIMLADDRQLFATVQDRRASCETAYAPLIEQNRATA